MKETSVIKGGVSVGFRSYIKIEKSKRSLNPIQDEVKMEGGGAKRPLLPVFPCNFYKPRNYLLKRSAIKF